MITQSTHPPSINFRCKVIAAAVGVAVSGPFYQVPPGATVRVRAHNDAAGNVGNVTVGGNDKDAVSGPNETLTPNTETIFPCQNLQDIWVAGAIADGIVITVKR